MDRKERGVQFSRVNDKRRLRGIALNKGGSGGVALGSSCRLGRIIIATSLGSPLRAARAKGISLATGSFMGKGGFVDSPSIMGGLRNLSKITNKARLVSKLCMRNKGGSSGLFLLSNASLCRIGRTKKLFSTFGASVVGGVSFCGDNFPTHCNKQLSSIISIHAGSNSVGRCRNDFALKLLRNEVRFRKPVIGSRASFGITVHHA